jgi:hypothetical protein
MLSMGQNLRAIARSCRQKGIAAVIEVAKEERFGVESESMPLAKVCDEQTVVKRPAIFVPDRVCLY